MPWLSNFPKLDALLPYQTAERVRPWLANAYTAGSRSLPDLAFRSRGFQTSSPPDRLALILAVTVAARHADAQHPAYVLHRPSAPILVQQTRTAVAPSLPKCSFHAKSLEILRFQGFSGGTEGARTLDLRVANAALSRAICKASRGPCMKFSLAGHIAIFFLNSAQTLLFSLHRGIPYLSGMSAVFDIFRIGGYENGAA